MAAHWRGSSSSKLTLWSTRLNFSLDELTGLARPEGSPSYWANNSIGRQVFLALEHDHCLMGSRTEDTVHHNWRPEIVEPLLNDAHIGAWLPCRKGVPG